MNQISILLSYVLNDYWKTHKLLYKSLALAMTYSHTGRSLIDILIQQYVKSWRIIFKYLAWLDFVLHFSLTCTDGERLSILNDRVLWRRWGYRCADSSDAQYYTFDYWSERIKKFHDLLNPFFIQFVRTMNIGYFYWNDFYWDFIVLNYITHIEGVILCDRQWAAFKLLYPLMSVNTYKLFLIAFSQKADHNFSFIKKGKKPHKSLALLTLVVFSYFIFLVFMPIRQVCYPKPEHFMIYLFFINNELVF